MIVDVPTGRQLSSGDTAKAAPVLEIAPPGLMELRFEPANERRYVGKSIPIADLDSIIRGEATYGTDPDRPTGASFPAVALTSAPEAAEWRISSPDGQ
jgi:isoquinoline 1-oxidoreductase subunit beta